jgi:hypothetical protein
MCGRYARRSSRSGWQVQTDSSIASSATFTLARGADFLISTWHDAPAKELLPGTNLSFYTGRAGVAFVLAEAWKATGETKYPDAAVAATQSIAAQAKPSGNGCVVACTGNHRSWQRHPVPVMCGSYFRHKRASCSCCESRRTSPGACSAAERSRRELEGRL